jgi:large subunit ribosomal protein L7Ae
VQHLANSFLFTATTLFKLLAKYRPEDKKEKKERLTQEAKNQVANKETTKTKPNIVKFGINQITSLVESRKAELVVIAHDVDPLELVLWLPTLCRKMQVPFCIVKGKARLGALCRQKTCTAVALTKVDKQDERSLQQFINSVESMYEDPVRAWGAPSYGIKSVHKQKARQKAAEREKSKRFG